MAKPVIGIVGGIGSGKSLLAGELAARGGFLIAGDPLGHEGLRQPEIRARVVSRFGTDVLNDAGEIDRRRLGRLVFAETQELKALERIVFPYIEARIRAEIERAETLPEVRFVILDAAILLEAGWAKTCDRILFVETPEADRLAYVRASRGWSEADLREREKAQWPLAEKRRHADATILNAGPLEAIRRQLDELLRSWNLAK